MKFVKKLLSDYLNKQLGQEIIPNTNSDMDDDSDSDISDVDTDEKAALALMRFSKGP
jgi:hypothetical protein